MPVLITAEELNAALVHNRASARRWGCSDIDELICAGHQGIAEAMERFDRSKGAFITYASVWIRKHQRIALKKLCAPVSIPVNHIGHFDRAPFECANDVPAPETNQEVEGDRFTALYDALAKLPERERAQIQLAFFDGRKKAKSRRALRSLRAILTGEVVSHPLKELVEQIKTLLYSEPGLTPREIAIRTGIGINQVYYALRSGHFARARCRYYARPEDVPSSAPRPKAKRCARITNNVLAYIRKHGPSPAKNLPCGISLPYRLVERGLLRLENGLCHLSE